MLVVVILNRMRLGSDTVCSYRFWKSYSSSSAQAPAFLGAQLPQLAAAPGGIPFSTSHHFYCRWKTLKCCSKGQTFKCSDWTSPRVLGLPTAHVSAPLVEAGWEGKAVLSFSLYHELLGTTSVPEPHLKWIWRKMIQILKESRQMSQPVLEKGSTVWIVTCCWLKTGFVWLSTV